MGIQGVAGPYSQNVTRVDHVQKMHQSPLNGYKLLERGYALCFRSKQARGFPFTCGMPSISRERSSAQCL